MLASNPHQHIIFLLHYSLHRYQPYQDYQLEIGIILDLADSLWIAINFNIHWKPTIDTLSTNTTPTRDIFILYDLKIELLLLINIL